ncbi:hypothetical protein CVV68_22530 [Arthrobacter livingstonensis]|uniref:Uncharacterized protein n=1 Tax=Arthrobacter livingstonensis TaxID=670078 RepID=A0A2V5LRM9_9MICC|nr:hypothetical protein CVV68_22530 [Arthrobacter livingstonensis]
MCYLYNYIVDNQSLSLLLPIVVGVLLLVVAGWVLQDARSHEKQHRPVTVTVLGLTVESSRVWAGLCLVLFAFAFPLYLVARHH